MIPMKMKNQLQQFFGNKIIPTLSEHSKIIHKGMLLWKECFDRSPEEIS